jgi:lysophospholipase L1-like esterase
MKALRLVTLFAVLLAAAAAGTPAARAAEDDFFFKPKDRIVFLGDSITEQYDYTNLIEYYLVTRFPSWDLIVFNAGIGGDTAGGGNGRALRDVLSEKPTAVTINFGMNDGGYKGPDTKIYQNYINNQTALVKKLKDAEVRVALMATSPVEGRKRGDGETYNETLGKFCEGLKEVAAQHGAAHVDQFHAALAVLHKLAADKASFNCFPDSVHTNSRGGLLMAYSILTGMHAPAVVSDVALEANGKLTAAQRCKVTDVKADGGTLTFTRLDESLPLVLSKEQQELLPYLDNLNGLNRYGLKVSGLPKDGNYELTIDGKAAGKFTSEDLDKGINLALSNLGPITAQSEEVWKDLVNKNQLLKWRFGALRRSASPPPGLSADEQKEYTTLRDRELAIIDKALEAKRQKMYEAAQPKPHQFELRPAK